MDKKLNPETLAMLESTSFQSERELWFPSYEDEQTYKNSMSAIQTTRQEAQDVMFSTAWKRTLRPMKARYFNRDINVFEQEKESHNQFLQLAKTDREGLLLLIELHEKDSADNPNIETLNMLIKAGFIAKHEEEISLTKLGELTIKKILQLEA